MTAVSWTGPVIDADVHVRCRRSSALPYLGAHWIEFVRETGFRRRRGCATIYPPARRTTAPRSGGRPTAAPGSSLELLREHVLDPRERRALRMSLLLGRRVHAPPRLRARRSLGGRTTGSRRVARPRRAAARRRSSCPASIPAAAARRDRPARRASRLRAGVASGAVVAALRPAHVAPDVRGDRAQRPGRRRSTTAGRPTARRRRPAGHRGSSRSTSATSQVFQAQLDELDRRGAVRDGSRSCASSLLEGGFTWLGPTLWRMDKEWKGLRRDIPWVERLSRRKTIREHVKVSVRPLDAGPAEHYRHVVQWLGSDGMLMFASDYPHDHGDRPGAVARSAARGGAREADDRQRPRALRALIGRRRDGQHIVARVERHPRRRARLIVTLQGRSVGIFNIERRVLRAAQPLPAPGRRAVPWLDPRPARADRARRAHVDREPPPAAVPVARLGVRPRDRSVVLQHECALLPGRGRAR